MLDTGRVDTSSESVREDLGAKIDQASDVLRQLERQLAATKMVVEQLDQQRPSLNTEPVHALAPKRKPDPFKPVAFLRCLSVGHDMVASRSMPGRVTCRRCKMRRRP